jgi:hypothetical protein
MTVVMMCKKRYTIKILLINLVFFVVSIGLYERIKI